MWDLYLKYIELIKRLAIRVNPFLSRPQDINDYLSFLSGVVVLINIIVILACAENIKDENKNRYRELEDWSRKDVTLLFLLYCSPFLLPLTAPFIGALFVPIIALIICSALLYIIIFMVKKICTLFYIVIGQPKFELPGIYNIKIVWWKLLRYVGSFFARKAEKDLNAVSSVYRDPRCPTCNKEYKNA